MNQLLRILIHGAATGLAIFLSASCTKEPGSVSDEGGNTPSLTVTPEVLTFEAPASSQELTISASGTYIGRSDDSWCTISQTKVSVLENTTGADRSTRLTIRLADGSLTRTVSVTQKKGDADPTPTPPTPDVPSDRFADTGKDVPAYPSYNKVEKLEDFPRIDITTDDGQPVSSKTTYKTGKITFKDPAGMYSEVKELANLTMKIRGRGNTTWNNGDLGWGRYKNPYRLKLDVHSKPFGMKGDKDWLLMADLQDPTLLRNAVAQRISRLVSMPWTPRFRCVELYINGAYLGCYWLYEAKEADRENKVPVTPVTTETDGGYYLEIDDKSDEDLYFHTATFGKQVKYKDPESPTQAQRTFIESYINNVESRLKAKKFTGSGSYKELVELDTFINQYLVQEVSKNVDGNMRLSSYFAKDKDTKLFMPFCWDFDLAFGNASYLKNDFYLTTNGPTGWFVKIRGGYPHEDYGRKRTYYQYMFEDPEFVQALKDRWTVVKPRLDLIPQFIDKMVEYNELAFDHNYKSGKVSTSRTTDWRRSVSELKSFYTQRISWLDGKIKALKASDDIETDR
ncbi:MAG: CotH kinase family protein [Bacteroidales bacterium]|nr:CotH kinase family protein [Bacteroidales bacterium]